MNNIDLESLSAQAREARARRAAHRIGLRAIKSRRAYSYDTQGGFMIIDPTTAIPYAGFKFDYDAEDVIKYCSE